MTRKLSDWISYYMEYCEDTEPPESYHFWTAISVIASALERKTYIQWGASRIYPNMYIVLVGPSGRTRKGMAMDLGRGFLDHIETNMAADSLTRERLIEVIAGSMNSFLDRTTNDITYHCSTTVYSKELAVFLGQRDIKFLADLTDWYDSHDVWKRETKSSGKSDIRGLCLNILGATAPEWFTSILPIEALSGGFTSRCIFIAETKKRHIIALPKQTRKNENLKINLLRDIEDIHEITGAFHFESEAENAYAAWYTKQEERANNGEFAVHDPHFLGYCERRATHIKKIAMVISASRSDLGGINLKDFERALSVMEKAEMKMPNVFGGLGASPFGMTIYNIKEFIEVKRKATRSDILHSFYQDLGSAAALDEALRILIQMHVIKDNGFVERDGKRKEQEYIWTG